MTEKELEEMEIGTFFLKLFYYNRKVVQQQRFYGEVIRLATLKMMNLQIAQSNQIRNPQELWMFSWEERKREVLTEEQKRERVKYLCELANRELGGSNNG